MKELKIVLVGEVDCGKSTLIGRFLYDTNSISVKEKNQLRKTCKDLGKDLEFSYLLDSFQEEREKEFTLDTTQAVLKAKNKEYLLIDVPGHRQLLKNMLTGASFADGAILVINAEKSLEEQSRRHLYLLKFLGIEQLIIVINKMDLVSYSEQDFARLKSQIETFLKEVGLYSEYIIPICAKRGESLITRSLKMSWYRGFSLIDALGVFTPREEIYDFRFSVQDIYEIKGERVTVGPIVSGKIKRGDLVKITPQERRLMVKEILTFNKTKSKAQQPESIGLVFKQGNNLRRGQIIYRGAPLRVTKKFEAKIFCLHSIDVQTVLLFRCATQEVSCKISHIKESIDTATLDIERYVTSLRELDAAQVVINTEESVAIEKFQDLPWLGRFVIEKNNQIIAVGIVS